MPEIVTDLEIRHRRLASGQARGVGAALARAALSGAAAGYGLAVRIRNRCYDSGLLRVTRVPVPVVSVGNLTVGGTGKTPMVEFLAHRFGQAGHKVALLSRGYRAEAGRPNDEACVLEWNLPEVPHLQGADRSALARRAVDEMGCRVLILDDGFQHRRLGRDLDIVLVDSLQPLGYGRLLPRGFLREPVGSLRRADLLVATRVDLAPPEQVRKTRQRIERRVGPKPWVQCAHTPRDLVSADRETLPLEWLADRPVAAFAGIGNPPAFWRTLEQMGCRAVATREFADHHAYGPEDMTSLADWARHEGAEILVTTQKDLVKIQVGELEGLPVVALRIAVSIRAGAEVLDEHLSRLGL